jgi:hypothetical protein
MEAICSSETSVATQRTTRRHIPEDDTLYNHRCEYLKSYKLMNRFVCDYMDRHMHGQMDGFVVVMTKCDKKNEDHNRHCIR